MSEKPPPAAMSTQHPDNVQPPFFSDVEVLAGEAEIQEAFYAFSHLDCHEQMWDFEGKSSDNHVVEKLLARYGEFFRTLPLGRDFRMTLRLPNPAVETSQGKVLIEALESIPRHYDIAKAAGIEIPPVYEIILPMTTSALEIRRVHAYYKRFVVGKADRAVFGPSPPGPGDISVKDWIGTFEPADINVIPLVEDKESLLSAGSMASELIEKERLDQLRFFLARSDPAMNYGAAAAVLYNKVALWRLQEVSHAKSVPIYPIIGVGSAPFRGNLRPDNTRNCLDEYPSVQTFTTQSSFKYDHPQSVVREGIRRLNEHRQRPAEAIDAARAVRLAEKLEARYMKHLAAVVPFVTTLSRFVPSRRARRLHIGLFGYARSHGGISLPRAIPFVCSLYSLGIPPEFLGLAGLDEKEWDELHTVYSNVDEDLADAARFANPANFGLAGPELEADLKAAYARVEADPHPEHAQLAASIKEGLMKNHTLGLSEKIIRAAKLRGFLG